MIAVVGPLTGLHHMFSHPFVRHAFLAGTGIALAAGLVGYFLVLRSQVFTADALSHVAFTGALVALIAGLDARVGLFAGTIAVAVVLGALGPRGRADDVVIGSTFAWVLGIGVLALSIFTTGHSRTNGTAGIHILFGSIYGLDAAAAWTALSIGAVVAAVVVVIARPLLFASIDEGVAAARGVPVGLLGYLFLGLVGATAAEATQAVGALLLLGLVATPAGIAMRLTANPYRGMALATAIAAAAVWGGLTLSYAAPRIPPSFAILAFVTIAYLVSSAVRRPRGRVDAPVPSGS